MTNKQALLQNNCFLRQTVTLPVPGKVAVHLGQEVKAGYLIAEAILPARFQVFDVLNHFRIKESKLEGSIKRLAQEEVHRGDVIARKPGLISRLFRAPEDGRVVAVRDGRVTLAMGEKSITAHSPINGVVAQLFAGLGAEIMIRGKSIRGAWGNGQFGSGTLIYLENLDEIGTEGFTGKIVFLDEILSADQIEKLTKAKIGGLIVPALNPLEYSKFSQVPFPLMSLAGFGETKTPLPIQEKLAEFFDQEIYLLAREPLPFQAVYPELFLPVVDFKTPELFAETENWGLGSTVQLLGMPYFGTVGKIVELPDEEECLASGVSSRIAVVERDDGTLIRVPLNNFEVLKA